jgi:GH18 family chitinase
MIWVSKQNIDIPKLNISFFYFSLVFSIEMYKQITALKEKNPDLKVMLAVGGWNHAAAPFTQMVATEQSRAEFAENSYKFLKQHGFDGLDLGKDRN